MCSLGTGSGARATTAGPSRAKKMTEGAGDNSKHSFDQSQRSVIEGVGVGTINGGALAACVYNDQDLRLL